MGHTALETVARSSASLTWGFACGGETGVTGKLWSLYLLVNPVWLSNQVEELPA